jgi:hypothetical protein
MFQYRTGTGTCIDRVILKIQSSLFLALLAGACPNLLYRNERFAIAVFSISKRSYPASY